MTVPIGVLDDSERLMSEVANAQQQPSSREVSCNSNRLHVEEYEHKSTTIGIKALCRDFFTGRTMAIRSIKNKCLSTIFSCLDFDKKASAQLIPYAIKQGQREIVEYVVISIAYLYPKMKSSGDLEKFDEAVIDMLRSEYVRYSQKEM